MINHDFDKLKELSKYRKYFSLKNNEFERPRKISQNKIKSDINIFEININMENINPSREK